MNSINERRVVEAILAIILVVILLISILLITGNAGNADAKAVSTPQTITNSQNTNSYNTYNYYNENPHLATANSGYVKIYDSNYVYSNKEYLSYTSSGKIERDKGLFGNDIDRYKVYVKNNEYKGGYFRVNFYFEDYYGDGKTETETEYIPAREEKVFEYTDIYADRTANYHWNYKVTSQTKI